MAKAASRSGPWRRFRPAPSRRRRCCAADGKTTTPQKPRELTAAVVRCDDKALVVSNTKGKETTFVITIETRFGPIGSLKNPEDFRPGNHVHVTYVKGEGGKLVAQQVVPILTHVFK